MARPMSEIELSPEAIARAVKLANLADLAMANRIAASDEGPSMVDIGLDAVLTTFRRDPQSFVDDNVPYLLMLNDALTYVIGGGEPTARLIAWAPGLEAEL